MNCYLFKKDKSHESSNNNYIVRKKLVYACLEYLKGHNKYYRDIWIENRYHEGQNIENHLLVDIEGDINVFERN